MKKHQPFMIEFDREEDGRWIAEVPKLPGVMAYGATKQAALHRVYALALRTLAHKAEEGRQLSSLSCLFTYELAGR
jgi:predicted RNase H-like HicB family nuclease